MIVKIGQFAGENAVSMDTVRYYMELGLLVPHKNGGHYEFDGNCTNDLQEIFRLKDLGFSLQEIKTFFYYKQFAKIENNVSSKYYRLFFQNKLQDTRKTIDGLNRKLKMLESQLAQFDAQDGHISRKSGIDLDSLKTLCCPRCEGELTLQSGRIEDNQVIEGCLSCSCKEKYEIKDGILVVEDIPVNIYDNSGKSAYADVEYLFDYINSVDPIFLNNIYKSLNWHGYNLAQSDFTHKTVLDLGVGLGFFLRSIYDKLDENTVYIVVDHDINALNLVKSILEASGNKKKILYVCADFLSIPIKKQSIDTLIDYVGTSNYGFNHKDFLLYNITKYLKDSAALYGTYIVFDKFGRRNALEPEYRNNFILDEVKKRLDGLSFSLLLDTCSEKYFCKGTTEYETYQQAGDVVASYLCIRKFSKSRI